LNANADLPLYFDSMLLYLRIQADAHAKLVPFFYQDRDAGKMCSDTFRDQFKWFTKKRSNFDPDYAFILCGNRKWFDRLQERTQKDFVMSWYITAPFYTLNGASRMLTLH
jgi:hypothetical protein